MKLRLRLDGIFEVTSKAQVKALRDYLIPLTQHMINVNEGKVNQERSYITVEKHYHDEVPPSSCEPILRWVKGQGIIIDTGELDQD